MSARGFIANGLRHLRGCVCGPNSKSLESSVDESESGAALVEFTILMPLFFLILFGIVEFGSMLWLQNNMTNAAREGARTSSVRGGPMGGSLGATQAACNWLTGAGQTFTITATDMCPGAQDVKVEVSLSKANASLFNTFFFIDSSGGINSTNWAGSLGAVVYMRKELICAGTLAQATCSCNTSGGTPTVCP